VLRQAGSWQAGELLFLKVMQWQHHRHRVYYNTHSPFNMYSFNTQALLGKITFSSIYVFKT